MMQRFLHKVAGGLLIVAALLMGAALLLAARPTLGQQLLITLTVPSAADQTADTQPLRGAEAQQFLQQQGILPQMAVEAAGADADAAPRGRRFLEPLGFEPPYYDDEDEFGAAVAVDGDTMIIGARKADPLGTGRQGAAYIYVKIGDEWRFQQRIYADDGSAGDLFGVSVGLHGNTAVVGARADNSSDHFLQGSAYVFERSGSTWTQQQKLSDADGESNDLFGWAVAVQGSIILIGVPGADSGDRHNGGVVAVYELTGGIWELLDELAVDDGDDQDAFGRALAYDGTTAVIGAPNANPNGNDNQGKAYFYTRSGNRFNLQDSVTPEGIVPPNAIGFGHAVDIDGDRALISARNVSVDGQQESGAAYIFAHGGSGWFEQWRLTPDDPQWQGHFGTSVALDGQTALVGMREMDLDGYYDAGGVYVFTEGNANWRQEQLLVAPDAASAAELGMAVALDKDTAVLGAWLAPVDGQLGVGKAYVTERGAVPWPEVRTLRGSSETAEDIFGFSVAVYGNWAVVGAPGPYVGGGYPSSPSEVYFFENVGGTWLERQRIVTPGGIKHYLFGYAVDIDGDRAIIGAPRMQPDGRFIRRAPGVAFIYLRVGDTWIREQNLISEDGDAVNFFGRAVALDGNRALVGATDAAYLFINNGSQWVQETELVGSQFNRFDQFGISVALDGPTAVVGARFGGACTNAGEAYIFEQIGGGWQETAYLSPPGTPCNRNAHFGASVAAFGNKVLVGAPFAAVDEDDYRGEVFAYEKGGGGWQLAQRLIAPDGQEGDSFGESIAMDGEQAVIGAMSADVAGVSDQGAAYLFMADGGWKLQQKLLANDGREDDNFGRSVALYKRTAFVGAPYATVLGRVFQGLAFVFEGQEPPPPVDPAHNLYMPVTLGK